MTTTAIPPQHAKHAPPDFPIHELLSQSDSIPDEMRKRDLAPRTRKTAGAFVFERSWGKTAALLNNGASKR